MPVTSHKATKGIQAPRLPKNLPVAEISEDLSGNGTIFRQCEIQQMDLTTQECYNWHFEEAILTQVTMSESHLDHLQLLDVRFSGCNLANATWTKASCLRAEFTGCRMTGFMSLETLFQDTCFVECRGDLAQFYAAKMRATRFDRCLLNGADFRIADLTGVVFTKCDLTGADFMGAKLEGADLRGCQIEGMRVGSQEMKGAIIDETQALALVRAMGITIS